jgi:penicillin-binding protein 1A
MRDVVRQRIAELEREWRHARQAHPRITYSVISGFAAVALVVTWFSVAFAVNLPKGLPDDAALSKIGDMDQATAVFDASDQLAFTIYKEQRIDVPITQMSPHLIRAIISTEDQRFYDHRGFDARRIMSAALANVRRRRAAQGASTITQQLARQSFLTPDKTLRRKLQEVILAARIERRYPKPRILELYLNKVYFGDGLYGVEAAARGFFNKHASELTIPEAATLAGLVKSPSSYAPTVSLERATARRNVVLSAMLENGAISKPEWQAARATKIVLHDGLRAEEPHGLYFKEQVRRELVDRFGWQRVYQGGLRVYSTIDMRMQDFAESAVAESLKAIDERRQALAARRAAAAKKPIPPQPSEPVQAALVAMDPATGHVRAMVGGRDFNDSTFNRAVQAKRQPGSAFKPFVYATAIEAGYTPATMIDNLDEPIETLQGAWTPEDEHSTAPSLSLRTALRTSSNRAAVQLLQQVGIARTVQSVREMGVGEVPAVPSLALGSGEVTLQSMTAAYAAFANRGFVPHPTIIRRVEDREGHVLYAAPQDEPTRAISETTAFLMSSMLADVVNAGTAYRARQLGFTLPAAGKTGTTNDFNDAWFIGYTPKLVAGVWVGFDQPRTILPNGFAGDLAVPMWARFMKSATRGDKPEWPVPPAGITTANVCRLSGKLASDGCEDVEVVSNNGQLERRSMVYTEYFVRGTAPTTFCDLHPTRGVLTKLAGMFGAADKPPAPTIDHPANLPPAPAATAGSTPAADDAPAPEPPKKKRGFWSKLFGVGKDDDKDKEKEPRPGTKKSGGE